MFSKACEYAIKIVIYINTYDDNSRNISLLEIAEKIGSPVAFTAKVLQQLKRSGLLTSTIGAKGGFQIRKGKSITIKEIVIAIDGDGFLNNCILGLKECSSVNPCPAHEAYKIIRETLLTELLNINMNEFSEKIKNKSIVLK